jgi:hypothetical protein
LGAVCFIQFSKITCYTLLAPGGTAIGHQSADISSIAGSNNEVKQCRRYGVVTVPLRYRYCADISSMAEQGPDVNTLLSQCCHFSLNIDGSKSCGDGFNRQKWAAKRDVMKEGKDWEIDQHTAATGINLIDNVH